MSWEPRTSNETYFCQINLLFWSGQSFDEEGLQTEYKFKAVELRITSLKEIKLKDLTPWLKKSRDIPWDYKNIVKRKGG